MAQEWQTGIWELRWSWPVSSEVLGVAGRIETALGVVQLQFPGRNCETGALNVDVPPALLEEPFVDEQFVWARDDGNDEYRIHAIGFRFRCEAGDHVGRLGYFRDGLRRIDHWLAWLTEAPMDVEPLQQHHHIPLSNRRGAFTSPQIHLEAQSLPRRVCDLGQVGVALESAMCQVPPAALLWIQGNSALFRGDTAGAAILATCALEVAMETVIKAELRSKGTDDDEIKKLIRRTEGAVGKLELLSSLHDDAGRLPSCARLAHAVGPRNAAAHSGERPEHSEAVRALDLSRTMIKALVALPS